MKFILIELVEPHGLAHVNIANLAIQVQLQNESAPAVIWSGQLCMGRCTMTEVERVVKLLREQEK